MFGFKYGELPYRSVIFKYEIINQKDFQKAAVKAYPQDLNFIRIREYTKLPFQDVGTKTVIAKEYPVDADIKNNIDPYYPILTESNILMYQKYLEDEKNIKNLFLCGRLADYKYYNMYDSIDNALSLYNSLIISRP